MGLLLICQKIKSLKIEEDEVKIDFSDNIDEFLDNEIYIKILIDFFKDFHLNLNLKQKIMSRDYIKELNEILDGKLEIK